MAKPAIALRTLAVGILRAMGIYRQLTMASICRSSSRKFMVLERLTGAPAPNPFSTFSRRGRGMKLRSDLARCLPAPTGRVRFHCPSGKLLASSVRSQTTIEPNPTAFGARHHRFPEPFSARQHHSICVDASSSAASFKQLYRTRPTRLQKIHLRLHMGRAPIQH